MCGIHGFICGKKRNNNGDDFVRQGFVAGSLRGADSSGMASITTDKWKTEWQKLPVSGPMFIGDKFANDLIRRASNPNTITICHTRAATQGGIGLSEAHPFLVEGENPDDTARELIGVHNGTLTGWQSKKYGNEYKVDSEWALNHIFDNGMKAFEDFNGAFAFVWWDSNDMSVLNIALNNERPMHVVFTDDDGMAFASEAGMLYWLCERNNIKMKGKVLRLVAGYRYQFDANNLAAYNKEKLPAAKGYATTTTTSRYTGYSTTSYKSDTEKVDELLKSLAGNNKSAGVSVFTAEVNNARDLMLLSKKAKFQPIQHSDDEKHIEGLVTMEDGTEYAGVIRNVADLYVFGPATVWDVTVVGAKDDGTNIEVITSRPHGISALPAATATN